MGQPFVHRVDPAQRRSEPGVLGDARGRRSALRHEPAARGHGLRRLREPARPARHPRRRSRQARSRLGRGIRLGPTGRPRRDHRQERPARSPRTSPSSRPRASPSRCCAAIPTRSASSRTVPARWRRRCSPRSVAARARRRAVIAAGTGLAVENVEASAFTIPTPAPESDGTLTWDSTTIVIVEVTAGATTGIGYCYAPPAAANVVHDTLASVVKGSDPMAIGRDVVRHGRGGAQPGPGRGGQRRDLGRRHLAVGPQGEAVGDLGQRRGRRDASRQYRSTGAAASRARPSASSPTQLGAWAEQGLRAVKMKVGRAPGGGRASGCCGSRRDR